MYPQHRTVNQTSTSPSNCKSLFSLMQIIIGVALVISSAYGLSLLHHMAVIIPAIMGSGLIFHGAKTLFICRVGWLFGDHQQQTGGMLG